MTLPLVGVLDACHAPSVSFVRSLARASVPFSLFAHGRLAAARWSRDARDVKPARQRDPSEP